MLKDALFYGFLVCALAMFVNYMTKYETTPTHAQLYWALSEFESASIDNSIADYGMSRGRYMISEAYYEDAIDFNPYLVSDWRQVHDPNYAEKIIEAYMLRYLGQKVWNNLTDENIILIARTHNGGPRGRHKRSTKEYGEAILNLVKNTNK